jgi:predicted secreted protein
MIKKVLFVAIATFLVVMAAGFSWVWTSYDETGQYGFTFSGDESVGIINPALGGNSTLEVELGSTFTLEMDANPSTGFQWSLAAPLNAGIVSLIGKEYTGPATDMVGAPGKEIWTFRAVGNGAEVISLAYSQPWDEETPPAVTKVFNVNVVPAAPETPTYTIPTFTILPTFTTIPITPSGRQVVLSVGGTLTLTLESNASTGYAWRLDSISDPAVVAYVSNEYVPPEPVEGDMMIVGAPGEEVWKFRATASGQATIKMSYVGPGTGGEVARTLTVTVIVP